MALYLIVGPTASGKSTALSHLRSKGFLGIESSDHIKQLQKFYGYDDPYALVRNVGRAAIGLESAMAVEKDVQRTAKERDLSIDALDTAVTGLRIPIQIDYLQSRCNAQLIGIFAPVELCFARHKREGREQYTTLEEFVERKLKPDYEQFGMGEVFDRVPASSWVIADKDEAYTLQSIERLVGLR